MSLYFMNINNSERMKERKAKTRAVPLIFSSVVFAGAEGNEEAISNLLLALVILLPVAKLAQVRHAK